MKNKYTHICYNTHHFNRNWNHGGHRNCLIASREYSKRWRDNNKDKKKQYNKNWRSKNKVKIRLYEQRRREQRRKEKPAKKTKKMTQKERLEYNEKIRIIGIIIKKENKLLAHYGMINIEKNTIEGEEKKEEKRE